MAKKRVPKVGDQVDAIGHHGAFVVSEINAKRQTAKLTRFGNPGLILNVGWHHIGFLDDQDASQAAARIVREATEDRQIDKKA